MKAGMDVNLKCGMGGFASLNMWPKYRSTMYMVTDT